MVEICQIGINFLVPKFHSAVACKNHTAYYNYNLMELKQLGLIIIFFFFLLRDKVKKAKIFWIIYNNT